ncbi:MAG: hypothetical protein ACM3TR_09900 [Caulobacteraceae bacterium]
MMINPEATSKEIAKIVNLPDRTVCDIQKDVERTDEFAALRQRKKEEFIAEAWEVVKKALLATNMKIDTLLSDSESLAKVNIRDLAVALGTIYDKQALASGEPTQISENKKPVTELLDEYEQKLQQYKQLVSGE